MNTEPTITVYIPAYKYTDFLGEAIESVLRQTMDGWELLLIDNHPGPDVEQVFARYRSDPRIRIIRAPGVNLPQAGNIALREGRGRYLIRLDSDDILEENILLVLGNYLDRHPRLAMVFPDYYLIDSHGNIFDQQRREKLYSANHILEHPVNGACCLLRRTALEELGGYREDLGAQDGFDIWSRLTKTHKCANVNIPLFYYRRHDNNLTRNVQRIIGSRRRIRRDAVADRLEDFRPLVAVIPCRQHYDFCENLWQQEVAGRTLLDHALSGVLGSRLFDQVLVTADTDAVETVMRNYGDPRLRFVPRDRSLTYRSRSIAETLAHIQADLALPPEATLLTSFVHSPFKTTGTIEEIVCTMAMNETDSALAVTPVEGVIFKRTRHGLEAVNDVNPVTSDIGQLFRETATAFATRCTNLRYGSLTGARIVNYILPPGEEFTISSMEELDVARILMNRGHVPAMDGTIDA